MLRKPFPVALVRVAAVFLCGTLLAQDAPPPPPPGQTLSPDQLDGLVAPIALYPDPLVSQILVASTYPLEVVQAYQWIGRNPGLSGSALTQAAQEQNWDPSVQALVIFPDVIKRLNEDVTWTSNLGNAFLAQQADVMDAIQRMRRSAQEAGRLASTDQQRVVQTTDAGQPVIEIVPANPEVIYVPVYDPAWIWGPPLWYPYPRWYWPARPVFGAGVFFGFGPGIAIGAYFGGGWGGWGGWGWHPGWGSRTVIVNNTFINRYNFNSTRLGNVHGTTVWNHDALHRQGVPYANPALAQRYQAPVRQNLRTPEAHGAPGAAAQPGERMGNRQVAPSNPNQNRSAFSGIENGQAARAHSDHGFASLGPARSGGARSGGGSQGRSAPAPRGNPGGGRRR
jgi:hypothetical protein